MLQADSSTGFPPISRRNRKGASWSGKQAKPKKREGGAGKIDYASKLRELEARGG